MRQLIRSVGAKLFFLPKYSPDLNPIEQVFAKLKHLLLKAAARTVDAVCPAIRPNAIMLWSRRGGAPLHLNVLLATTMSGILTSCGSLPKAGLWQPVFSLWISRQVRRGRLAHQLLR